MPEIFRESGYRFYFYSDDHEPIHIHVERGGGDARFALRGNKAELVYNYGLKTSEVKTAKYLVEQNMDRIVKHWIAYFGQ